MVRSPPDRLGDIADSRDDTSLDQRLEARLAHRRTQGTLRQLSTTKPGMVDFSSNDYLSLSTALPSIQDSFLAQLRDRQKGTGTTSESILGAGGSRLLGGNSAFAESLEHKIAAFHGSHAALLFNSAFDANVGLLGSIPQPGDVILYDESIHASVHDGMRLSRTSLRIPFSHASVVGIAAAESLSEPPTAQSAGALEDVLEALVGGNPDVREGKSHVYVCVEALYSMDGDVTDLGRISEVVKRRLPRRSGHIIMDEAHSVGILGDQGRGLVHALGLQDQIWARVIGFGKAMGCAGGAVLCSSVTRLYLINYARTLIYTTSMPFYSLASIDVVYDHLISGRTDHLRRHLQILIQYFQMRLRNLDRQLRPPSSLLRVPHRFSGSPIIPLFTSSPRALAQHCQSSGFMIYPIVAPTVPQGKERVRVCLHAANTIKEIDRFCQVLEGWVKQRMETRLEKGQEHVSQANRSTDKPRL